MPVRATVCETANPFCLHNSVKFSQSTSRSYTGRLFHRGCQNNKRLQLARVCCSSFFATTSFFLTISSVLRKHVIHTVGPIYDEDDADQCAKLLASCYRRSLEVAEENSLKSVVRVDPLFLICCKSSCTCYCQAFPSVSTGIYGYPVRDATHLALNQVRQHLDSDDSLKVWGCLTVPDLLVHSVLSSIASSLLYGATRTR